jgi:RNA polymerase sigma-70 factor (ECF subfamily)
MDEPLNIEVIYREHASAVARVIQRLTGSGAHVDDLLQECFVTAFRERHRFDPGRAPPKTWLFGIAVNLCRRHHRTSERRQRLGEKAAMESAREPATPDRAAEHKERLAELQALLAQMSPALREVFTLYEIEEQDGATIAEVTGVPLNTVWTRLARARKTFAQLMKQRLATQELA